LNNQSSRSQIDDVLEQTYQVDKEFLDLIRQTLNLTQKYQYLISTENISTPILSSTTTSQISKLSDLNTSLVSHTNDLNNVRTTLTTAKDNNKKVGVNTDSQNLTVQQKEYDLKVAKDALNNCYITAPFSGVITAVNTQIKINDQISTSTTLATIVTNQQIAEITLNEVDVAKVKVGQKVNITFDALSDLTLTGSVIEIDEIGAVTQGVVTYNVHISFDQQDKRIKQGMSLTVNIITDIKTDIYLINGSAIKEDNIGTYVEVLKDDRTTEKKYITVGLSNDTQTEIVDGLVESDNVIIKSSTTSTTKQTIKNNTFSIPGMSGNAVRMR
jgi:HlyD family secretion protein